MERKVSFAGPSGGKRTDLEQPMSVTQLIPQETAAPGRQGPALALPQLSSLAALAPLLSQRLARCRRAGEQLALLWIELSVLPSPRGEPSADRQATLLRTAGQRVRNGVRSTDEVVQVGANGLAVVLAAAGSAEAAIVAQRLRHLLTGAYELDGKLSYAAVATGEAAYPDSGNSGTELAQAAQQSLALRQGG